MPERSVFELTHLVPEQHSEGLLCVVTVLLLRDLDVLVHCGLESHLIHGS